MITRRRGVEERARARARARLSGKSNLLKQKRFEIIKPVMYCDKSKT